MRKLEYRAWIKEQSVMQDDNRQKTASALRAAAGRQKKEVGSRNAGFMLILNFFAEKAPNVSY